MNCPECQELLLQGLDGPTGADAALEQHVRQCPDCRELARATRCLQHGLTLLPPPRPPEGLADALVGAVLRDRHARRFRVALAALAACVLLAVGLALRWFLPAPHPAPVDPDVALPSPPPRPQELPPPEAPEPAPSLQESVAQAGSALSALTARTAGAAVERTWPLLPRVPVPAVDPMALPPLDAPARPFVEAGQAVSEGLEPVASSARRAVGVFLRELSPMDPDDKPGL
jgi:hypothetical protein